MKRIVLLAAVAAVMAWGVPAFAGDGSASSSGEKEKSLFQIVADTMKGPCKVRDRNRIKAPCKTVHIFQNISDGIREGAAKAKRTSLRGTK